MKVKDIINKAKNSSPVRRARAMRMHGELQGGQGTTEYGILIAIVVVGVAAVVFMFRDKLLELWNAAVSQLDADLNTVVGD